MELRRAEPADAAALADVWLASFKATYPFPPAHPDDDVRRWIREEVVPREDTWVVVEDGGAIVGLLSLVGNELDQLYVRPDRLGRGIGSRLLDLAKSRRSNGLALFTFQVNTRARGFYERRGFTVEWFGDGSGNEEHQPDVRYAWKPTASSPGPG